jgi:hypothetical protein
MSTEQMLARYEQIEARFGLPKRDAAGAVAAFIAGNYMAYRDVDFPDSSFPSLVAQMREVIAANPAFASGSQTDKRTLYEQLAVVGMQMALQRDQLKHQPDPKLRAQMMSLGRSQLEQFLKSDVTGLVITPRGLAMQ